jgi:hypothetical protein
MRGVVVGSTLPSHIHDRFSLSCTGGSFSRGTINGGIVKLRIYKKNLLVIWRMCYTFGVVGGLGVYSFL